MQEEADLAHAHEVGDGGRLEDHVLDLAVEGVLEGDGADRPVVRRVEAPHELDVGRQRRVEERQLALLGRQHDQPPVYPIGVEVALVAEVLRDLRREPAGVNVELVGRPGRKAHGLHGAAVARHEARVRDQQQAAEAHAGRHQSVGRGMPVRGAGRDRHLSGLGLRHPMGHGCRAGHDAPPWRRFDAASISRCSRTILAISASSDLSA